MTEAFLFYAKESDLSRTLQGWADVSDVPQEVQGRNPLTGELVSTLQYRAKERADTCAPDDVDFERYPHIAVFNFSPRSVFVSLAEREPTPEEEAELERPFKVGPEEDWIRVVRLPDWFVGMLREADVQSLDKTILAFLVDKAGDGRCLFFYQSAL